MLGGFAQFLGPYAGLKEGQDFDEDEFQEWYRFWSNVTGLAPNPDDPEHMYDYRSAYIEGDFPSVADDEKWHWPSKHKAYNHPNRFVEGEDTKFGIPASYYNKGSK